MLTRRTPTVRAARIVAATCALFVSLTGTGLAQEPARDEALAASLQAIVERLPEPEGSSDAEHLLSLMGLPDAFHVTFEPDEDGTVSRREEWTYYELEAAFDLKDGQLLADLPLEELPPVVVSAPPYAPAAFTDGATWESLADVLVDPDSFESVGFDEYELEATAYVGDSIMLIFDEDGGLFYVETYPLVLQADA